MLSIDRSTMHSVPRHQQRGIARRTSRDARLLLMALLWVYACGKVSGDPAPTMAADGGTCSYDGHQYSANAQFASADGCKTCTCFATGDVVCTLQACMSADAASDATTSIDASSASAGCHGKLTDADAGFACSGVRFIFEPAKDAGDASLATSCMYDIPRPPTGAKVDITLSKFLLVHPDTSAEEFSYVPSPDSCTDVSGGFYLDDPTNATHLVLCACSCELLNSTQAAPEFEFSCGATH